MHRIVLTFDDGPDTEATPRILDVLAREHVQAVFFILGVRLASPGAVDIVRRAAREGHVIGNHTFSHPKLTQLSSEAIRSEIMQTHNLIAEFEPKRRLFRPPFGLYDNNVRAVAKELQYKTMLWNAGSGDWQTENQPSAWVDVAIEQIKARRLAVCLCHDYCHTADHLPQFFEKAKQLPKTEFVRYDRRWDVAEMVSSWFRRNPLRREATKL